VEKFGGSVTLSASVLGGRSAKVGIERVDPHGAGGLVIGLDVANRAPIRAQPIDLGIDRG
jgi:hypothetical protein